MNRVRSFFIGHKTLLISLGFLVLFSFTVSYATPPASPYAAGQTLDPQCAPGDANCSVAVSPWTASGTSVYYSAGNVGIGTTAPSGLLTLAGSRTAAAWGLNGINFQTAAATYTDSSTATSGTAASNMVNTFGVPTLASTNTLVTYTNAATVYIAGNPIAGANVAITNSYALKVDGNAAITGDNIVLGNGTTTNPNPHVDVIARGDVDGLRLYSLNNPNGGSVNAPYIGFYRSTSAPSATPRFRIQGSSPNGADFDGFKFSSPSTSINWIEGSVGNGSPSGITSDAANNLVFAQQSNFTQGVVVVGSDLGAGTAPIDGLIRSGQKNGSVVTDVAGSNLTIQAGRGAGNSTTKGDIIFQTPDAIGSGAGVQTLTTKMRIARSGSVGIGIGGSTPATTLEVGGGITGTVLNTIIGGIQNSVFSGSGNGYIGTRSSHPLVLRTNDNDVITLLVNKNVGIGTSSPTSKLDITTGGLGVTQTDTSGLAIVNTNAAALGAQQISPALRFTGNGWGTTASTSQAISFRQYVVPVQDLVPSGYLTLESSVNGGAYANAMAVTSAGFVGIGTTAPTDRLSVVVPSGTGGITVSSPGGTNNTPWFSLKTGSNQQYWGIAASGANFFTGTTVGDMVFRASAGTNIFFGVDNGIGSAGPILEISANSQVGIGTITPGSRLQVNGGTAIGYSASTSAPLNGLTVAGNVGIGTITPSGALTIAGSRTAAAWGTSGVNFQAAAATYTDSSTAVSGTATNNMVNSFGIPTLAAANTGVTYSNAATVYIAGAPVAGTNATITNSAALVVASGKVGFSNTTPGYLLHVGSSAASGIVARFENSTGTCDINPTTTALVCSSDMNLKKNITLLADNSAWNFNSNIAVDNQTVFSRILALTPVSYNWNNESNTASKHPGFIAQDVRQLFPDLVSEDKDTHLLSMNYTGLIPYTVQAIQEMNLNIVSINDLGRENTWRDALTAWLGNASNHITRIFTGEICLSEAGQESECLNRSQLKALKASLNNQGGTTTVVNTPPPTPVEVVEPATQTPSTPPEEVTTPVPPESSV
ncbi:MAG: cell wall surface anchor family protein [Candidatus Nomurabacteria bacterium]|nr:cell wall surface anchor family protein [Candidatus Nomurabacteria bacterium]